MSTSDLTPLVYELNVVRAAAIAAMIHQGSVLREAKEVLGGLFTEWCPKACRITLAEAELLMRAAAKRPDWINASAVDLNDPEATDIEELLLQPINRLLKETQQ